VGKSRARHRRAHGGPRNVAWIRSRLAVYQVGECRWAECEAGVRHAAEVAERVGDLRLWEEARTQYALLALYCGRFEQSLAVFREVQHLSRRSGDLQIACWAAMGEGAALCRLGRDEHAVRRCTEALTMIDEKTMKAEAIKLFGVLALARLHTQDAAGAFEAADRAVEHIRAMKPVAYWMQPGLAGAAEVLLSLVAAGWSPTPAVRKRLPVRAREAVTAMQRFARHFPLGRPYAALWSGTAAWTTGHPRRAHRLWARAISLAEQLGTPYELARTHREIGRTLPLDSCDRLHHLHQAEEQFEKLGAARDLAAVRAEAVASNPAVKGGSSCR
jgi:tetratricopeptide (TPR) repeat protein